MITFLTILLFSLGFLTYCLTLRKPERAIYAYLMVWILCPKYARLSMLGDLPDQSTDLLFVFDFVNAATALGLLLVCLLRRPRTPSPYAKIISYALNGFLVMTAVSFVCGLYFTRSLRADLDIVRDYIRPSLAMVYGVIFGWAFLLFINTRRKVEMVFACFVFSGVELTAEAVLIYYFDAIPALRPHIVNFAGRFMSVTYLSFDTVGLVSIVAICSTFYFAATRKSMLLLALTLLMFLPIIATSERAPLSAAALSLLVAGLFCVPRHYFRVLAPVSACMLVFAVWLATEKFGNLAARLNGVLGGDPTLNGSLAETFYARVGLWLRGIDIFLYKFPFGAGNNLSANYMTLPVPAHSYGNLNEMAYANYQQVVNSGHVTNLHNAFLEFVVENGVLGIAMLALFGAILWRRFRCFLAEARSSAGRRDRRHVAQACIYACMVGMGWRYMFESSDKLYFLFFAMLTMLYLLRVPGLGNTKGQLRAGAVGSPVAAPLAG